MQEVRDPFEDFIHEGCIRTFTGLLFNVFEPDIEQINIEDIAHHLSIENRWLGATARPVSVAEHSLMASYLCDNPLEGLLHDADEAYTKDMSRTFKTRFPEFVSAANVLHGMISELYGVPAIKSSNCKLVDRFLLKFEFYKLIADFSGKEVQFTPQEQAWQKILLQNNWYNVGGHRWEKIENRFLYFFFELTRKNEQ